MAHKKTVPTWDACSAAATLFVMFRQSFFVRYIPDWTSDLTVFRAHTFAEQADDGDGLLVMPFATGRHREFSGQIKTKD